MFRKIGGGLLFLFLVFASSVPFAYASSFDISLTLTGFNENQEAIFGDAETYWENLIIGYQPGITLTGVAISAEAEEMDGLGGVLGSGGPDYYKVQEGYTLTTRGSMSYDEADLGEMEDWELYDTIVHEIAHVLGFGTFWEDNGLYADGTFEYTGAAALAAYRAEYDPNATFVPVENDGGPGTAGGHWELDDFPGEMMTGWSLPNPAIVSETTKAAFVDLGYKLAASSVPEPTTALLFGGGLIALTGLGRRKKQG